MLDAGSRILLKDGATVRLTPKAFETLLVLVQHAVQVVEKEQLLKEVWPPLQVFVADADGGNVKMITRNPASTFAPCWSPDGATICFTIDKLGVMSNIFQIDLDGGNRRRLTAGPKIDAQPAISPDGARLAFQSNRDGNYEIYVMNLR